jgi:ribosomal protein L30E
MSEVKKLLEAHNGSVIEHEVSAKMIVVQSDNIDPKLQQNIEASAKAMGAAGAFLTGTADKIQAIDVTDKLLVIVSENVSSIKGSLDYLAESVADAGGIAVVMIESPATILTLDDEQLAMLGLQRISRRKDA